MKFILNSSESLKQDSIISASIGEPLFGELSIRALSLFEGGYESGQVLQVAEESVASGGYESRSPILIMFQFKDKPSVDALKKYVEDRSPALSKHGGRVLVSAVSQRENEWPFDGFEIIDFPDLSVMQSLMADDDYRSRTSTSGQVFGGAFAAAPITID